ncbi:serine/threonine-protein kinase [Micromonospora sp. NBC_01813]|uniref:serine/threonine-protein kinase n=1 Tax=Micromonospora sp. NBC_01813 TaxID=2975988 RepID=UPI002DDB8E3E|nr:protein kinase [Micromonospora sp. NBC_01813]WSA09995.1 protein kinase [Micromonospora sp. NBC_01813]
MVFGSGLRLDRRYVLADRIGLGGMSEVWRASDDLLDRAVAVKALAPPIAPAVRAACRQEARAAARITHPHVTQVYDYGEAEIDADQVVPYLVLELVEGENLAARLATGPLPWRAAIWLTAQVASGLAAAHRIGVVHRDIKPGNVMLTASGAKILDFGIAAVVDGRPAPDAGWLLGTPAYAAPERLRHCPAHPAADVYALGAVCYEMLTGAPPLPANSWREAAALLDRAELPPRPAVTGLPAQVAEICLACLRREPADRPTAGEVASALHAALGVVVEFPLPDRARTGSFSGGHTLVEQAGPPAQSDGWGGRHGPVRVASTPATRLPAGAPADPRVRRGERPRSPLAVVGLAGAGAAAVIAFVLVATSFLVAPPSADSLRSAASPQASAVPLATARPPLGSRTARGGADAVPPESLASAALVVEQFDLIVADGSTTGLIRADAAADLRDAADGLRLSIAEGTTTGQLQDQVGQLRLRLAGHRQEGTVDSEVSIRLDLMLAALAADTAD